LFIGLYIIFNCFLAVVYISYTKLEEKKISKFDDIRNKHLREEF
jgi:hypothetical protein